MVLNTEMKTPKAAPQANRVLWLIVCLLAVIAVCLIVLVVRQSARLKREIAANGASEPVTPVTNAQPVQSKTHPVPLHLTMPRAKSPAPALPEPMPVAVPVEQRQPTIIPVIANERQVSTGLAPLAELQTNWTTLITGRVTLTGTPPVETTIIMDALCGKLHSQPVTTRRYVVSTNGGLANVLVYIKEGLEGKRFDAPAEPAVLAQTGCEFQPYVLGLMANQKLRITNSDEFFHNVDALPQVRANRAFNVSEAARTVIERSFREEEIPVRIKCDVHPWMFAYVCVVKHPFFAVTDGDGNFSISNAPPGNYVLAAYHVKTHGAGKGVTQPVTLKQGIITKTEFTIELSEK